MMAKVVQFPVAPPAKLGPQKARRKRKPNLEDFGQLNLFNQSSEGKVRQLQDDNYFELAMKMDEADNPEAERYYLLAIGSGQSVGDAHCNLGILYSKQDAYPKAIDHLSKCLQQSPRHFEAHYNLGNVYSEVGNYPLARTHYQVAIEIAPDFPNSHYNLALVLISDKAYKEAQQHLQKYISLSPGFDHGVAKDLIKTLETFN